MPDLPGKKVGIVSCSGEEIPEGTVSRLAALKILEQLRPADTVTICLPLFLAGGEGDRAFARFYSTIAIDGCEKRCAARGTEMYSGKPAAGIVVSELATSRGLGKIEGKRHLNEAGRQAVESVALHAAGMVDELLHKNWNRTKGAVDESPAPAATGPVQATCSCGSGIPVQDVLINGKAVTLIALPLIFQKIHDTSRHDAQELSDDLLAAVKIYNPVPPDEEDAYAESLIREYAAFINRQEASK
jgi:hypothetical protein